MKLKTQKKIDRKLKSALLKELNSIISDLKYKEKYMNSDYRDDNYANINDIEYILGDIDDYYMSILASLMFHKVYQRYHIRGDETRSMSVKPYLDYVSPYLIMLIDENKADEQKIQLDIGFNMVHIDDKRRITHFSKPDNIICRPSSDTNVVLNDLLSSLYDKCQVDLTTSRTSSSFVFESVEESNIHFQKIDLRRGASHIESPDWLKNKKFTINPKNKNDVYCFMHVITVALYHNELGSNPEPISKKLMQYANKINWHNIDFPASYEDYVLLEQLNSYIALNILYVPFGRRNVCPEYIFKQTFTAKTQVTLLKITDDKGSWHFLALPSVLDESGVKRPVKALSKLMNGISSSNHGDFYCYGCFHSFRTQKTLQNHLELCEYNDFHNLEVLKEGKNVIRYKPGSRSLKINSVIYADFECILMPYSGCDKENVTTKNLNKHVPFEYSINVVNNHSKETKQTVNRGENAATTFFKELHKTVHGILDTETKSMQPLSKEQQELYDNAKYCHICKKVFGKAKKHKKVRDHDHYTGKFRGAAHCICNLRYRTQIEMPVFFHNGTNYDFNLLIEELAKEYNSDISCIPLNTNKYMSFSVPIKKEMIKSDDDDDDDKKSKKRYLHIV